MVDVLFALKRPLHTLTTLLIATVIIAILHSAAALIPQTDNMGIIASVILLVLASIFLLGYCLRCAASAYKALPDLSSMGTLLKDGFMAMIVGIIYLIPGSLVAAAYADLNNYFVAVQAGEPLALVGVAFYILGLYLLPLALLSYKNQSFKSAMALSTVVQKAVTMSYAGTWVFAAILILATSAISWSLSAWALTGTAALLTVILVNSFLSMLSAIWAFTLYGLVWDVL